MKELVDCPMCGFRFDPGDHAGCQACPLNRDCTLVCCPQCGHSNVDPSRSRLASWFAGVFFPDEELDEAAS